jgi:hypothetical protein
MNPSGLLVDKYSYMAQGEAPLVAVAIRKYRALDSDHLQ